MQRIIPIRKVLLILVNVFFFIFYTYGQSQKDIAIKNFELYFTSFKNAYPKDSSNISFNNYSSLKPRIDIPEELKIMIVYDSSNFYNQYLYHIKYLRDTLINISKLNLDVNVKTIYSKFRLSIINGDRVGNFNYKEDKQYSIELGTAIKKSLTPQIGYYQTTAMIMRPKKGKTEENKILIIYSNEFKVIGFNIIEK